MEVQILESSSTAKQGSGAVERFAPLCGIAFAVLFFLAFFIASTPANDASDARWTDYFANHGHRIQLVVSAFLFVLAALAMLVCVMALWSRIRARAGDSLSMLPLGAAILAAAGIAIGGVLNGVVAGALLFGSLPEPSAVVLRFSDQLGFPVIAVAGMIPLALAMGSLAILAERAGVFGTAMTRFSLVMAVLTLASFLFFPLLAMLVWFIVVGARLYRNPAAVT